MYIPNTPWSWAFMGVTLLQALISWALEVYIFVRFQTALKPPPRNSGTPPPALDIPTYLGIFIFGFLYQLILVWDALRLKNTIQVIGICLYNVGMLIYAAVEMSQVSDAISSLAGTQYDNQPWINQDVYQNIQPYLIAAPCVIAFFTVVLAFIAWKLYDEFAWTIYKHISADVALRRRFLTYQIYIALLKFDFFFFLGFTVQFLVVVTGTTDAERGITIAAIPVTVILLFLAAYICRRESYVGQCAVMLLYLAGMAYFIFKLVRMYASSRERDYLPARHSLTSFAVLTLLLLIVTIITSVFCLANFGKGLKPHIQRRKVPNPGEMDNTKYGNNYFADDVNGSPHPLGPLPARMTID